MDNNKSDMGGKYVIFKLNDEFYGIDIHNVKAIERIQSFTRVPNGPDYIKGVINLRGEVVPVIDLRKRFKLTCRDADTNSRIIIVVSNEMLIGLMVDSSSEVTELIKEEIDSPPNVGEIISEDYVKGIGKKDNRLIILINLEKVLGNEELED